MREVIITSILQGFDLKKHFFSRVLFIQVQQFRTGTRYDFQILHKYGKRVETNSLNVFVAIFYACRSYRGKTGSGTFLTPILNKAK